MNYYLSVGGETKGPFTAQQLSSMWNSGNVTADALYCTEGATEWLRLEEMMSPGMSEKRSNADPPGAPSKSQRKEAAGASGSEKPKSPRRPLLAEFSALSPRQRLGIAGMAGLVLIGLVIIVSTSSPKRRVSVGSQPAATEEAPKAEPVYQRVETLPAPPKNTYPEELRQSLVAENQKDLSANKQWIFNDYHPTGKAKSVKVNDVTIKWATGYPGRQWKDVASYSVRFILYWEGPITTDGYSEIEYVYDTAIDRVTSARVLRSNGITRDEIGNAVAELAVEGLKNLSERAR